MFINDAATIGWVFLFFIGAIVIIYIYAMLFRKKKAKKVEEES